MSGRASAVTILGSIVEENKESELSGNSVVAARTLVGEMEGKGDILCRVSRDKIRTAGAPKKNANNQGA